MPLRKNLKRRENKRKKGKQEGPNNKMSAL